MNGIGPYLAGAAFWIFIGAVAVAAIITDYKRRRGGIEVLRAAIDKGQQLDTAVIEKLTSTARRDERIEPVHVKLGGIITLAAGVGICLLSFFISRIAFVALYPILGCGVLVICVGVGLLIGARTLADARAREPSRHSPP
ncbi:MAG: DUF6249 domain-containing protein [Steroidobacteraceae bacterium]